MCLLCVWTKFRRNCIFNEMRSMSAFVFVSGDDIWDRWRYHKNDSMMLTNHEYRVVIVEMSHGN